jgi:hypothetical protein
MSCAEAGAMQAMLVDSAKIAAGMNIFTIYSCWANFDLK